MIADASTEAPVQSAEPKPVTSEQPKTKKDVEREIKEKSELITSLSSEARKVTIAIGELAVKGVGAQDGTVELMQDLVDQLRRINDRLDKLSEDIEALKGWVEGQNEALPIMAFDIGDLKRSKNPTYLQFQFRNANGRGSGLSAGRGKQHAWVFRRIRIGSQLTVDPKTRIKLSFDGSTGSGNTAFELRDAVLEYDIVASEDKVGTMVTGGQQALPLGYELQRSSSEREFPERATYNRIMFDGERNRGVNITHGLDKHSHVTLGVGSSLTFNDGEQRGTGSTPGGRSAIYGAYRTYGTNYDFGISHFTGERPALITGSGAGAVTHREFTRSFTYIDGTLVNVLGTPLILRAEGMQGHDRRPLDRTATSNLPTSPRNPADISGYQFQLGYNLSPRNQIFARYAVTDFNTDTDGNAVREYGLVYRYFINPGATITFAHEIFEDAGATNAVGRNDRKYQVSTLRWQYRF